jgi:hypothetical protein
LRLRGAEAAEIATARLELLAWLDKVRISVFKDAGLSVSFLFSCKRLQEKTMRQPRVALGTREEVIIPNAVA